MILQGSNIALFGTSIIASGFEHGVVVQDHILAFLVDELTNAMPDRCRTAENLASGKGKTVAVGESQRSLRDIRRCLSRAASSL
jgi:hypothetical protein